MLLLAAALAAGGADPLEFHAQATVADSVVRLADVADLSSLPPRLRERAADVVVGEVSGARTELSSRTVSTRARAAVPGLSDWLPERPDRAVVVLAPAATPLSGGASLQTSASEAIEVGDRLVVRTVVGPVTIERNVTALQAGRPGHPVFVRTAEGAVLTAQVEAHP